MRKSKIRIGKKMIFFPIKNYIGVKILEDFPFGINPTNRQEVAALQPVYKLD